MVQFNEDKHTKKLREIRLKEEEDLAQQLSEKYGFPYVNLALTQINEDALRLVPEEAAREANLVPFKLTGKKVAVATSTPTNKKTEAAFEKLKEDGYIPEPYLASNHGLENAWGLYEDLRTEGEVERGVLDISVTDIENYLEQFDHLDEVREVIDERLASEQRYEITHLLELIIAGALGIHASDIHIEPKEDAVGLRYRLDGVLQEILEFEEKIYNLLLSRIKLLSGLKLNVKDDAQDGRFSIKLGEKEIEIRTSTTPGAYGESIVMRVLDPDAILVDFESLGIESYLLSIVEKEIQKPHGMVITTGPTGSGKTTTLYSFLRKVSSSENKVITIENPVEYHIEGITQTQVDPEAGYTFLEGLRAALRQDPDVIMVGEIRDGDTARTAVNAALTGHIVFSTLHTNTAAGAFPRLIDLGANPKTLGSALNVALAQRLVRKLCESCKEQAAPTEEERAIIEAHVETLPEQARELLPAEYMLWRPGQCDKCNNTGYKGRIGIFEGIVMDEAIENIIIEKPSEREVKRAAADQGIPTMAQDGILKALRGITSLEELGRVVELSAE